MSVWSALSGLVSLLNLWGRKRERDAYKQAGAFEQKSKDYAAEREAMDKGDEQAEKIRTGDDASAFFKRMRKRRGS